ncbi:hypothetical protein [Salinivibrio kushneri]|uniref:hypothetical protein n=1 Tax=Salinivibrio kushneri TaxID=1908198 RepID=UPI001300E0EA|nr:hypothetical protein [Salinivibrio kushneri]
MSPFFIDLMLMAVKWRCFVESVGVGNSHMDNRQVEKENCPGVALGQFSKAR